MKLPLSFSPHIGVTLQPSGTKKLLNIFIDTGSADLNRHPMLYSLDSELLQSFKLEFSGFDEVCEYKDYTFVLKGKVFLIYNCENDQKILLSDCAIPLLETKTKSLAQSIVQCQSIVQAKISREFENKIQTALQNKISNKSSSSLEITNKTKKRIFIALSALTLLTMIVVTVVAGLINKKDTQNSNPNFTTSDSIVQNDVKNLNHMLDELGLDRKDVQSDLSCFGDK